MPVELWMVEAIIRGFKLDAVTRALEQVPGFGGMTVSDCRGFGHEKLGTEHETGEHSVARRSDDDLTDFKPKVRLEIAVAGRDRADAIAEVVARSAHTGRGGDGKVFLWPLARAIRIRTLTSDKDDL